MFPCVKQAVHLAPRQKGAAVSCQAGDHVWIDASRSDTAPHFNVRFEEPQHVRHGSGFLSFRLKHTHLPR
jgi:hypothetical protein